MKIGCTTTLIRVRDGQWSTATKDHQPQLGSVSKLKEHLCGENFSSNDDVKAAVKHWLSQQPHSSIVNTASQNYLNVG